MKYNNKEKAERVHRKHCPKCCFYVDGRMEAKEDGSPRFFFIAGMRHYRKTEGTVYEKAGTTTTCSCEAGAEALKGFGGSHNGRISGFFSDSLVDNVIAQDFQDALE